VAVLFENGKELSVYIKILPSLSTVSFMKTLLSADTSKGERRLENVEGELRNFKFIPNYLIARTHTN
jgi:hypothetical protein